VREIRRFEQEKVAFALQTTKHGSASASAYTCRFGSTSVPAWAQWRALGTRQSQYWQVLALHKALRDLTQCLLRPPCRLLFRPAECRSLLSCPPPFLCILDRWVE